MILEKSGGFLMVEKKMKVTMNGNELNEALKHAFRVKSFMIGRLIKKGYGGRADIEFEFLPGDEIYLEGDIVISTGKTIEGDF